MTLHKTKRIYEAEKVAAQLNTLKDELPNLALEKPGAGNMAPKAEKTTHPGPKKESPSLDLERVKTEKDNAAPTKSKAQTTKYRKECIYALGLSY